MPKDPREVLQIGPFQLLWRSKTLFRDGHPVALAPRAVEVLAVLAAEANQIVSKDELMVAVWPNTFVEEVNLAVHISALRKLFASADSTVRIETMPKRGYRLLGDVQVAGAPALAPGGSLGAPAPAPPAVSARVLPVQPLAPEVSPAPGSAARWRPKTLGAVAATVVLLLAAGVWLGRWASSPQGGVSAGGARIDSLAVLPLENLSGDPGQDYFAAGITDALTTELAHFHGLRVVSRTSASQFPPRHRSLPDIARALGVRGVIEGSVVRDGNRVRITAQLIDAPTDRHLWAGTYEDSIDGIIALQDRAARDVAREVRAAVKPEASLAAVPANPFTGVDRRAYDDYLHGLYILNRRDGRTFDKAIEYFSLASKEDPNFAPAFASLADVDVLYGLNSYPGSRFASSARQAALQALAKDNDSAEAHAALAATSAVFAWDWTTAGREFQRAIELDPNYATGHQWYADFFLVPQLRLDEAARETDAALALDPISPIMLVDDGWVLYLQGKYPQARKQFDRALAIDPNFIPAHFRMTLWYLAQGRGADFARAAAETAMLTNGSEVRARAVEDGFARDGVRGVARAELQVSKREGLTSAGMVAADFFNTLGETARACAALREAIEQHDSALLYLNVDPAYTALRKLPCYREVALRTALPQLPAAPWAPGGSSGALSTAPRAKRPD